jgi:hypothetical protein
VDDLDSFAAEQLVECGGELAVAVVDREAHPFENGGEAEVARLLDDPASGRVGRAAGEVDASTAEFDEEQDVQAAQRDRLDREEVAGEQARRLAAQKHGPAHRCAPRRGLEPGRGKQAPNGAR